MLEDFALRPEHIRDDLCKGCLSGSDYKEQDGVIDGFCKNGKTPCQTFVRFQCSNTPADASGLCQLHLDAKAKYDKEYKPKTKTEAPKGTIGVWHGIVRQPPLPWQHTPGSAWWEKNKMAWNPSVSETESVVSDSSSLPPQEAMGGAGGPAPSPEPIPGPPTSEQEIHVYIPRNISQIRISPRQGVTCVHIHLE
jgi:hypothetical protein